MPPKSWKYFACSKSWTQKWIANTSRRVEGFRDHTAIDGSLKGLSGRDAACGWAVVQPRRTIARNLWYDVGGVRRTENDEQRRSMGQFAMTLSGLIGPSTIHTDSYGHLGWLVERRPWQKDADLWDNCE